MTGSQVGPLLLLLTTTRISYVGTSQCCMMQLDQSQTCCRPDARADEFYSCSSLLVGCLEQMKQNLLIFFIVILTIRKAIGNPKYLYEEE